MFSDPDKNINLFGLVPGMKVADFGAGAGLYTFAAARAVGPKGRVYAIDIQKDLLTRLQNTARGEHLTNIEAIWGDLEAVGGTKIKEASVDFVILTNLLFQAEKKDILVKEAYRILKTKGKLGVIDWTDSFGGIGPRNEDIFPESKAIPFLEEVGFQVVKHIPAGEHHYGLIMEKK